MRKVNLRMNENYKYEVIKNLVDQQGNKKAAMLRLNCSIRTINRLIIRYKEFGKEAFIHGNRDRKPSTTIPQEIKAKVVNLYMDEYGDANLTHFCEIIKHDLQIEISSTTLNHWLREQFVLSPKAKRKTKRMMKQLVKHELANTRSEKQKNRYKETISILDSKEAHPKRPRCKFMGEMIQMDASSYDWIPNVIWHLHLAVDDATGAVVGAYFDYQETLYGYYHVFHQILCNYGIPAMFYTDKRTVFEYKRKNTAFDDEDTFTQFSYACHQLGVDIKTTSVAQAKGRIERLNQTFQSRLPIELRRAHITTIDAANEFLKSYLKKFNEQFALCLNSTQNVFEKQPEEKEINTILSVISARKVDAGHSIKYKNKYYKTLTKKGMECYFKKGSSALVIEAFDKQLYANILDQLFVLEEIPEYEKYSRNFDCVEKEKKEKKLYIPPMTHPWKQASYRSYLMKMKHRESQANV